MEDFVIEWLEPLYNGLGATVCRAWASEVAKAYRAAEPRYLSDEDAVDDFMVINWACKADLDKPWIPPITPESKE